MREGPLAALFRKTEDLEKEAGPAATSAHGNDRASDADEQASTPAAQAQPAPETPAREAPHPSLRTPAEQEPDTRVPSPQERLRHAFSSEIPDSVLDRPAEHARVAAHARQTPPMREHYEQDHYAQEERPPFGQALPPTQPVIRVVGVGGAGTNAVNRMVEAEVEGVEFLAVNTDLQSLQQSTADITLHIGAELTRGLGSGSDANVGRQAAMDDYDRIKALLKGSDMIFIAAGAGGGTGTGAAPIVARIAREIGALTVAIVTKPFGFEGSRRAAAADEGVVALAEEVDTLIVVPNDRLLGVLDKQTAMVEAFRVADDVLRQGVQGISDLVTLPGLINLDFADVRTIMSDAGSALLGIGMGVGENRAVEASVAAASSPLLDTSMEGARSILLSITGGRDLSLWEVNEAAKAVSEAAHPDANIIFGAMVDEKLEDQVWVTVVATGYGATTSRPQLREPAGEPRVKRTSSSPRERERGGREPRRGGLSVSDREVPEFIPNF
ncbi:MAG TPA: cell division protein FtsZ [Solirubrobacteraceae bacterium]|jgi:cell division protein FtsZ|nr:cell division protein FtsZ [Solirubrobacteraceae bacterium]